jgi:glutamate-1-semialdehyde 2,1-aminomutase
VTDLATAKRSDRDAFARYFRHCLEHRVYFAPSQFETGFLSTAHTAADLEQTAEAVSGALV